jgi:ATP synthase protein I
MTRDFAAAERRLRVGSHLNFRFHFSTLRGIAEYRDFLTRCGPLSILRRGNPGGLLLPEFEGFAMAGQRSPENGNRRAADRDEAELAARLRRLGEKLDAVAPRREPGREPDQAPRPDAAGFARAMRLSGEFVGGVVVGALLGWLVDWLAGTSPWGMIVFLLLGFAAGVFNVMRSAGLMAQPGVHDEDQ